MKLMFENKLKRMKLNLENNRTKLMLKFIVRTIQQINTNARLNG